MATLRADYKVLPEQDSFEYKQPSPQKLYHYANDDRKILFAS